MGLVSFLLVLCEDLAVGLVCVLLFIGEAEGLVTFLLAIYPSLDKCSLWSLAQILSDFPLFSCYM